MLPPPSKIRTTLTSLTSCNIEMCLIFFFYRALPCAAGFPTLLRSGHCRYDVIRPHTLLPSSLRLSLMYRRPVSVPSRMFSWKYRLRSWYIQNVSAVSAQLRSILDRKEDSLALVDLLLNEQPRQLTGKTDGLALLPFIFYLALFIIGSVVLYIFCLIYSNR